MGHKAIDQVLRRAEVAKSDSDFTYFFDCLLLAEAVAKVATLGMVAAIADDKDRNRYRLEYAIVRSDGLGDWYRALDDALTGLASQYLVADAYPQQTELTRLSKDGDWQYLSIQHIKAALDHLKIEAEDVPVKSDMKRWFRLLATLRNKTRAHGATKPGDTSNAAEHLRKSVDLFYEHCSLFERPWAYLHRNLSGKYRISPIAGDCGSLDHFKKSASHTLMDGVYIVWDTPRLVPLLRSSPELEDFYFANGNFSAKRYECLSYQTDNRTEGDSQDYCVTPGVLPSSETQGRGELLPRSRCFSNAPEVIADYVSRPHLEEALQSLLLDDRRPIVTLRGKGGIGKTSLALRVLENIYPTDRYMTVVWLSSRDVDLKPSGPKQVRPDVISPEDMSALYAHLVLSDEALRKDGFNAKVFFERQMHTSDSGPILFVLDNFETTQNPLEMFTWIDTYIRLPNKVLITTRLRDFKGDYPVDVTGMTDEESKILIQHVTAHLRITQTLDTMFVDDLIRQSEGHPYVIKILLGEVARLGKAAHIPRIVAGSDEILTALFERTYSALSPCAQRAFLTLSAWTSSVPRLALEAVLLRSTGERQEVESGVESLLQYSLAETYTSSAERQEILSLPLVASVFGKKKLNISPYKDSIQTDVDILRMLGPNRRDDVHPRVFPRLERFVLGITRRVDSGEPYEEYESLVEMICRNYPSGWLILARWHTESNSNVGFDRARGALNRFLESDPPAHMAAEAWRQLAFVCFRTGDTLGEIHAFIERAQLDVVPFYDVSNTANRLNELLREHELSVEREDKRALAQRLLSVLEGRRDEADADDLSRMAWLAIHLRQEDRARQLVREGLSLDSANFHCRKLASRLAVPELS